MAKFVLKVLNFR